MKIKKLDSKGEFLPIMEYFLSIQGEGYHTGTASFFIRIGGCDVGCHWCDVKESWNPEIHPLISVNEVLEHIPSHIETIVLTGGEPSLYNLDYITTLLKKSGKKVHLETSGTGNLSGNFDWVCLSPKKNEKPKNEFYKIADEMKVIVHNKTDFQFAIEQAHFVSENTKLFLQPEWSKREQMLPLIIRFVQDNPIWKISLQTHKYLKIP
jgi:organic radical activating enzyme